MHDGKEALELSKEGRPTSVHGGSSYWRIMRATATALKWKSGAIPPPRPCPSFQPDEGRVVQFWMSCEVHTSSGCMVALPLQ